MKKIIFISILFSLGQLAMAHHAHQVNSATRKWQTINTNQTFEGTFYLFKNNNVYVEDNNGNIKSFPFKNLSLLDRTFVLDKQAEILKINQANSKPINTPIKKSDNNFIYILIIAALLILYRYEGFANKKIQYSLPTVLLGGLFIFYSFSNGTLKKGTDINFLKSAFEPFRPNVNTRWDDNYFYVESIGIPEHEMMKGITGWQQQFPIPQCYIGTNAWSIPLNPVKASTPVPVNQQHFLRGAVAVAANGIAIFNPYTNTGVDAFLDGQLDEFGGHCGRADDYHYHTAPLFLDSKTTDVLPIAFALDGYAVYGSLEPDGSAMKTLDANHGHEGTNGLYHYHGTTTAPYMIGNMVGKVTEDSTLQIIPQASAKGIRPAGTPLKGAVIQSCKANTNKNGYTLTYTLSGKTDSVEYSWTQAGNYTFNFYASGVKTTNTYKGTICSVPNTSSVQSINSQDQINIYPNPATEVLYINLNSLLPNQVNSMTIYNINGQEVYDAKQFKNQIDLKAFDKGIYFIKIKTNTAETIKKIVIE